MATELELLRLKTIARIYVRGLPPDVAWDDLLQEALTRIISGARRRPQDVTIVAFVAGIMRSLRSEHWRRVIKRSRRREIPELELMGSRRTRSEVVDQAPSPERALSAQQEIRQIERLFADDPQALKIIAGMGSGLSAEQIQVAMRVSKTAYNSARRRMRRALLREGLTCEPK
jgi:RNA polymerase sigma-70 factor (ECF subfamily)